VESVTESDSIGASDTPAVTESDGE
jgi:hypothetical protein